MRIVYTPAAAVPWTLIADTALIADDQNSISLSGNVRAVRSDTGSETATEVRTHYLEGVKWVMGRTEGRTASHPKVN